MRQAIERHGAGWAARSARRKVIQWPPQLHAAHLTEHYRKHFALDEAMQLQEAADMSQVNDYVADESSGPEMQMSELLEGLAMLKKRTAPGTDGITTENIVQGHEALPHSWTHERVNLIPKDNPWTGGINRLRPLLSPSTTHKLYSRILLSRLTKLIPVPAPQWCRQGFSPASVLHHFSLGAQRCLDHGIPLYVLRIDLSNAYDT
eukprot:6481122-Amphidinium_carterae.1